MNRIWEAKSDWTVARRDGTIFLGALLLVLVYGETRLAFANSQEETLQVAMINLQRNRLESLDQVQPDIVSDLLGASKTAAVAGAKVIAWSEANADIPVACEEELVELGKRFAMEHQVFLCMSFRSFSTLSLNENKTIGIAPSGETVVDYVKSNLVPVLEAGTQRGEGQLATADIDGVRTGHVICYDGDFPSYIQQASRQAQCRHPLHPIVRLAKGQVSARGFGQIPRR